jgi:hypothetical protein
MTKEFLKKQNLFILYRGARTLHLVRQKEKTRCWAAWYLQFREKKLDAGKL